MNLFFKLFGGSYDDLWKAIIRPNKDEYTVEELGPYKFELRKKCYKRTDFELINKRSQKLICSFWEPFDEEREKPRLPCVIYLHGNSSSRCEAYPEVKYLLQRNITVFAFDFCGCGQSEGEYISLGYYEKKDVHCVVEYLLKSNKVSKIGLWGRSMGAVTAIMYANEHPKLIDAMFLDSGFYSLNTLINELIESKISLPKFIFNKVLNMVKETVKEKAKFDMDIIEPYIYAKNCLIPAFFCHGSDDSFVLPHHCVDLFNEYKCKDKFCEIVKGGHNSPRPRDLRIKACDFLTKYLRDDDLESIGTINNSNSYERVDINYNLFKNIQNNKSCINIYNNLGDNFVKNKIKSKTSKKKITKLKKKYNNNINDSFAFLFKELNESKENNISLNPTQKIRPLSQIKTKYSKNKRQNIRTLSQNKYSRNHLKVINKKNTNDNVFKRNRNLIKKIRKNEENISSSSSSSYIEDKSLNKKIKYIKKGPINSFKIQSLSISQYFNNNSIQELNFNNTTPLMNKTMNDFKLNTNTNIKKQSNTNNNKSFSFLNQIIKENGQYFNKKTDYSNSFLKKKALKFSPCSLNRKKDKVIIEADKTYSKNFYNPNSNMNIIQNNYFTTNNIYFNKYIGNPKKKELKKTFSYAMKKPMDKYQPKDRGIDKNNNKNKNQRIIFLKFSDQKKLQNNKNINNSNNINGNNITTKRSGPCSENTIVDENEETIGRNIPY